ncbi:hypothetical protein PoB_000476600 [Plakobranchus ocellatus]|uniref:Uncharacterized protein n=1 Tax=Plakobranchus ocellatus TaxID=259542 RepID=A0AAV3XSG6_9GAST|nr:hypothetical protein PoB_000476600 [Plakobranchus ocellatus]
MPPVKWNTSSSLSPKKGKVNCVNWKVMLSFFKCCEGVIMTVHLKIEKNSHRRLLLGLADKNSVRNDEGKSWKFPEKGLLQHDSTPAHRAQQAVQTAEQCGF